MRGIGSGGSGSEDNRGIDQRRNQNLKRRRSSSPASVHSGNISDGSDSSILTSNFLSENDVLQYLNNITTLQTQPETAETLYEIAATYDYLHLNDREAVDNEGNTYFQNAIDYYQDAALAGHLQSLNILKIFSETPTKTPIEKSQAQFALGQIHEDETFPNEDQKNLNWAAFYYQSACINGQHTNALNSLNRLCSAEIDNPWANFYMAELLAEGYICSQKDYVTFPTSSPNSPYTPQSADHQYAVEHYIYAARQNHEEAIKKLKVYTRHPDESMIPFILQGRCAYRVAELSDNPTDKNAYYRISASKGEPRSQMKIIETDLLKGNIPTAHRYLPALINIQADNYPHLSFNTKQKLKFCATATLAQLKILEPNEFLPSDPPKTKDMIRAEGVQELKKLYNDDDECADALLQIMTYIEKTPVSDLKAGEPFFTERNQHHTSIEHLAQRTEIGCQYKFMQFAKMLFQPKGENTCIEKFGMIGTQALKYQTALRILNGRFETQAGYTDQDMKDKAVEWILDSQTYSPPIPTIFYQQSPERQKDTIRSWITQQNPKLGQQGMENILEQVVEHAHAKVKLPAPESSSESESD